MCKALKLVFLLLFTNSLHALEQPTFKSQLSRDMRVQISKTFVFSNNGPSYVLIDDNHKQNATFQALIGLNKNYTCQIPVYRNESSSIMQYEMTSLDDDMQVLKVFAVTSNRIVVDVYIVDMRTCHFTNRSVIKNPDAISGYGLMAPHGDGLDLFFSSGDQSFVIKYNLKSDSWSDLLSFRHFPRNFDSKTYVGFAHVANGTHYLLHSQMWEDHSLLLVKPPYQKASGRFVFRTDFLNILGSYISTSNQAIGYCILESENKFNCARRNANFKQELTYKFKLGYRPQIFNLYNLKNGEMLLVAGRCSEKKYCEQLAFDYIELKPNKPIEPAKEFTKIQCNSFNTQSVEFFERNDNVCVRVFCTQQQLSPTQLLKFHETCF